ncbi:MAG: hypothetical protein KOO60_05300 [Gemmatimonadales bacterium]|nr:hypothetical protein [Gemmatimonadales bacterium]
MASGKTTVARRLGPVTGRAVVSLDDLVVRRAGCSIPEIFSKYGELHFRNLELEILQELDRNRDLILDGGGGLVETPAAVNLIREQGAVIWLDSSWESVLRRLEIQRDGDRPLVSLLESNHLENLFHRRLPLYAQAADFRLQGDGGDPEAVAGLVNLRCRMWQSRSGGRTR